MTTVLLIEALRAHLSDTARLIFISSAAAAGPGGGPYGAAKAALHGWMYDLAVELGPTGMTCNIVAPGFIDDTALFGNRMTPERRASLVADAAKAALHGWMYDLAVELGPIGVTCNIVAPGFIDDTALFGNRMTAERRASLVERTLVLSGRS